MGPATTQRPWQVACCKTHILWKQQQYPRCSTPCDRRRVLPSGSDAMNRPLVASCDSYIPKNICNRLTLLAMTEHGSQRRTPKGEKVLFVWVAALEQSDPSESTASSTCPRPRDGAASLQCARAMIGSYALGLVMSHGEVECHSPKAPNHHNYP